MNFEPSSNAPILAIDLGKFNSMIPVCFVVQSSSGTGRADGPMDFAVRDEPAWIPSREESPPF